MLGLLRLLMIIGGIAGSVLYLLKKGLNQASWRKGISEVDYNLLKDSISNIGTELVELNEEELKLLSLNNRLSKLKKNGQKLTTGLFNSIYQEGLMEFVQLDYDSNNSLLLVSTTDQEFVYRIARNGTTIYQNGTLLGVLNNEGRLMDQVTKKVLLSIDVSKEKKYQPIMQNEKQLAQILNPLVDYTANERVFQSIETRTINELSPVLALTFLNMIQRV